MENVYDILERRGYIKQATHDGLRELLGEEPVTFYVGFDATADSLHVGHFVMLMVMARMQRAGHKPIALIGGGTTMVGDPSGKSDMRKMLTREDIQKNANKFREQIGRFLDFSNGAAIMEDNANWLLSLNYVDFLRDIGAHFSVNRMLTAECYKKRLETGLTFFEFNYMLMQAYDFLVLNRKYGCKLQLGGDDQWSNILAGADLIRRKEQKEAHGLTMALLLKSDGAKMGKTESGALWLDADKTSPYDFYQYFRNVADPDVKNCLMLLTFLPEEEIENLTKEGGSALNEAKKVLAYEVTKQVHGREEADKAQGAAEALFAGGNMDGAVPTIDITKAELSDDGEVISLLMRAGLTKSKGEGRRLIAGGGITVDGNKVTDEFAKLTEADFKDGRVMLKKGKKGFVRVSLK